MNADVIVFWVFRCGSGNLSTFSMLFLLSFTSSNYCRSTCYFQCQAISNLHWKGDKSHKTDAGTV